MLKVNYLHIVNTHSMLHGELVLNREPIGELLVSHVTLIDDLRYISLWITKTTMIYQLIFGNDGYIAT